MAGRGHTSDRLAVLDMLGYQLTGQRAHADFIAAVPDRHRLPRPGGEKIIEGRCVRADVETSHVARRAVGAAPAALDRDRVCDPGAAPFVDYCVDIVSVDRDTESSGSRQCRGAGVAAG